MKAMQRTAAEANSAAEQASITARAAAGALLLAAALSSAGAAEAQPAQTQSAAPRAPGAGQNQLIEQARFWMFQGRVDLAIESLQRVLQSEPNNPAALAEMARAQLSRGDVVSARDYAGRLRKVVGETGLYAQVRRELEGANIDQRALTEARALAGRGDYANAIVLYERALRGEAPQGALALEYFETMAGVPARKDEARAALARLAEKEPNNRSVALALSRVKSYDEATRREALDELLDLADTLAFRPQALDAARQALLWLTAEETDKPLFDRYFEFRADDADVKAKWASVSEPQGADRLTVARARGYEYLEQNRLKDAEAEFSAVLDENRRDAEATAGLGIVRGRQDRFAEAEDLLRRAVRLDPSKRLQFEEALEAVSFAAELREARRAAERGDADLAESILSDLAPAASADRARIALVRAEAAVRVQDWRAAEAHYQEAFDLAPLSDDAFAGLVTVFIETDQAAALERLVLTGARGAARRSAAGRAAIARAQGWLAAERGEVRAAASWYADALALDPKNPWLRLSAARAFDAVGREAEADQLFARAQGANDSDLAMAAALFRSDRGDWGGALDLLAAIPPGQRSPEAVRLMARAQTQLGVVRARIAAAAGEKAEARRALIALYAAGATAADDALLIGGALIDIGDPATAGAVVRESVSMSRGAQVQQLAGAVQILMASGDLAAASGIMDGLARRAASLPPQDRLTLANLHDDFVVAQARAALAADDPNLALDLLTAVYRANPVHPGALRALGQLNLEAGRREDALAFYLSALDVDATDRDALRGAVGAANAMRRYEEARGLIDAALLRAPSDPALYLLAAETARASGDRLGAIAALETARRLDRPGALAAAEFASTSLTAENPFRAGPQRAFAFDRGERVSPEAFEADAPGLAPREPASREPGGVARAPSASSRSTGFSFELAAPASFTPLVASGADFEAFRLPAAPGLEPQWRPVADLAPAYAPRLSPPKPAAFLPIAAVERGQSLDRRLEALGAPGRAGRTTAEEGLKPPKQVKPQSYYQREIAELQSESALSFSEGVAMRWRNGEKGLSELTEFKAPLAISAPIGPAKLTAKADAVFLDAGDLTGDSQQSRRFGALATVDPDERSTPDVSGGGGVGLALNFGLGGFEAELGTTPLGFEIINLVGGVSFEHRFENGLGFGVAAERKAVTDSVLSYAGAVDPVTGFQFGGAVDTRLYLKADQSFGNIGVYMNASFGVVEAVESDSNAVIQVDGGAFATFLQTETSRVSSGFNVTYLGFENNRRYFTLGHGGYFSPQSYFSAAIPLNYRYEEGALSVELATALGVQYFSEDPADFFPGRADLMLAASPIAAAEEADAGGSSRVRIRYEGQSETSLAARAAVKTGYRLTQALALDGELSIDRAADWTEVVGLVRLKYWPKLGR